MKTEMINNTEVASGTEPCSATSNAGIQLADYKLENKLGAGGYGEVWRAIGPGGLQKAIKILYGERHGEHAEAEMKALERMRDLRHPFLLSIERIEVVDSRLIVVTELADGNLTDRFAECRQEGKKGIPRDELLGYLKDSADALDFMFEHHGLQHLDIKPDNILLQGNHAKVGDFGLAKDLNATNVSMVNGFTPLYAAPELFEGRPGRATDQYSLAIVYHAMLTGKPPFNGRTAAQLTAQHLRSQPDLSELQPIDRPVIARALSKNTNSRFENCRQFVDELVRRKHSRPSQRVVASIPNEIDSDSPLVRTALVKTDGTSGPNSDIAQHSEPVSIKPASLDGKSLRPSIVIGVGGLGGATVLEFKNQTADSKEAAQNPIPVLAIDSCQSSLSNLRSSEDQAGLSNNETVATPLRTPKAYRSASNMDLSWLSRRWLFNIPRNCQVQGIRPLGRLALCDHQKTVVDHIATVLDELQLKNDSELDVYVVGSSSGGTASGMIADIGLMIRKIALDRELTGVEIHGILLHATAALRTTVDVQEANTASLLKELQHMSTPGMGTAKGFTNDSAIRDVKPFDNTFFFHLGDGLSNASFQCGTKTAASMLACLTTTPAQFDLRAWNEASKVEFDSPDGIRILGVGQQDADKLEIASEQSQVLSNALLSSWCGRLETKSELAESEIKATLTDTNAVMEELRLTEAALTTHVMQLLRGDIGKEIEAYATHVNRELIVRVDSEIVTHNQLLDEVSQYLSAQDPTEGSKTLYQIVGELQKTLSATTRNCETVLLAHLNNQLTSPYRFHAAEIVSQYMAECLTKTRRNSEGLLNEIEQAFQTLTASDNPDGRFVIESQMLPIEQVAAFGQQYCVLLAYQTVYQCFIQHVDTILQAVDGFRSNVTKVRGQLAAQIPVQQQTTIPQELVDAFDQHLRSKLPQLPAAQLSGDSPVDNIISTLNSGSVVFLLAASASPNAVASDESHFPKNAWPQFRKLGGRRRVLGMIPESLDATDWESRLTSEFGECVATRSVSNAAVTAICEIEGVSMGRVFSKLTHDNPHIADVASRVHTRNDIEW